MKKLIALVFGFVFVFSAHAYAKIGDIAGNIYSTDILTQVDGVDITGYAVEGETMIALEDLRDYGFNVYYNDNVRSLFVTKTGKASADFNPQIPRGTVGKLVGHYYETDIVAYVNSIKVPTYAIDGKLVVSVEELTRYVGSSRIMAYVPDGEFFSPTDLLTDKYYMKYEYDDSKRLLSLTTNPHEDLSLEAVADIALGMTSPWRVTRPYVLHNDKYLYYSKTLGGIMRGPAKTRQIICENGIKLDVLEYIRAYGLHSHMDTYTEVFDPVFSVDGEHLYMVHKFDGGFDYKKLNISNGHITPLDESEYQLSANHIKNSGFEFYLDNIKLPLYSIGGRDYICAGDLQLCGFTVNFDEVSQSLCVLNNGKINPDYTASQLPEGQANPADEKIALFLNGGYTTEHDMYFYNDSWLLPVESFTYDEYTDGLGTIKYTYDIKNKRINARTAEDTELNYDIDLYDLTKKYFPYQTFYYNENPATYDSGNEYPNQVVAFDNDVYIKVSDCIIHSVTQQLMHYMANEGFVYDISSDDLTFDYDGEYITYKLSGETFARYNVDTLGFEKIE